MLAQSEPCITSKNSPLCHGIFPRLIDSPAVPAESVANNIATKFDFPNQTKPDGTYSFAPSRKDETQVPYTPSLSTLSPISPASVIRRLRGEKNAGGPFTGSTFRCPTLSERAQRKPAMKELVRIFETDWDNLRSDADKAHRAFVVADLLRTGIILSFTLNLSERRQATLLESNQPARDMSHEINRALKPISKKTGFKFPYGFVFEVSQTGKLHIHGFVVADIFDEDRIRELDAALTKAGGYLTGKHQITKDSQNELGWLYDGHGYFEYSTKAKGRLSRYFGGMDFSKLVFVSGPMRNLCRFQETAEDSQEGDADFRSYHEKAQKLLSRQQKQHKGATHSLELQCQGLSRLHTIIQTTKHSFPYRSSPTLKNLASYTLSLKTLMIWIFLSLFSEVTKYARIGSESHQRRFTFPDRSILLRRSKNALYELLRALYLRTCWRRFFHLPFSG